MVFNGNDYAPPDQKYTDEEIEEMKEKEGETKFEQSKEDRDA